MNLKFLDQPFILDIELILSSLGNLDPIYFCFVLEAMSP